MRALLFTAQLSIRFWAEALHAVVYLYNRTSHSALDFKSSYEIKYDKKSNIENIWIWDSIAYNRVENAKKLDKQAKSYILIDYNDNQYKLLNIKTKRVVWSWNIVILKSVFSKKWKNTENYDINNYINVNNDYEIIFNNVITSHISFRKTNNVDRIEN